MFKAPRPDCYFFAYIRVSTRQQQRRGYSLKEQTRRLSKFFHQHTEGYEWGGVYQDVASARKKPFMERVHGKALFERARRNDLIVSIAMDRCFRSLKDMVKVTDYMMARGIHCYFLRERIGVSEKPIDKFLLRVMSSVAELEAELIRERTPPNRNYNMRFAPLGFKKVQEFGTYKYVVEPTEMQLMRTMYKWRFGPRMMTNQDIVAYFNRYGIKQPRTNTPITYDTVSDYSLMYRDYLVLQARVREGKLTPEDLKSWVRRAMNEEALIDPLEEKNGPIDTSLPIRKERRRGGRGSLGQGGNADLAEETAW